MKLNDAGIAIITSYEKLELDAYICPAGIRTIGYGHTQGEFPDKITEAQADDYLLLDLAEAEQAIKRHVKIHLTENQYSALVSFIFNIGGGAFKKSTMLKLLNQGCVEVAALEFPKWRKGGGKILKGLVKRRATEKELFLS